MPKASKAHAVGIDKLAKDARNISEVLLGLDKLEETDRVLVEEKLAMIEKLGKHLADVVRECIG